AGTRPIDRPWAAAASVSISVAWTRPRPFPMPQRGGRAPPSRRGAVPGAAALDAGGAAGQHLRGAAPALRVEGVPQRDHRGQVLGAEQLGHERHLLDADAVLACDAPPHRDALVEDLVARPQDALHLVGVALVEQQDGMDVPVPRVEDVGDADLVALAD